jgi:hypothetical protein
MPIFPLIFAPPDFPEVCLTGCIILPMITVFAAFTIGIAVFVFVWLYVAKSVIKKWGKGAPMTFTPPTYRPTLDPNGNVVYVPTGELAAFEPRHERYIKVAEVVTTLASASLIFVPNSRLNVYPHSCSFALVLLGLTVFYSIGFMALISYFYEGFLFEPTSYSQTKYALVHALGFGGLICFGLAYIWLAARVGWAVIYAMPSTPATAGALAPWQ